MLKNLEQIIENVVNYFTMIKDVSKYKKYDHVSPSGRNINFSRSFKDGHENFLFSIDESVGEIHLNFEIKHIERGEPYRHDPRSVIAPSVYYIKKTSKKKLNKFYTNETKAIQAINKFFGI